MTPTADTRTPEVVFSVYRIWRRGGQHYPHWANRWHTDKWFRSWQAEWEHGACLWCPRAWTQRGAVRKARRWFRRGTDIKRHERRYGPNLTARQLRAQALMKPPPTERFGGR